jgi:hypothetical protein
MDAPENPAGVFVQEANYSAQRRAELIEVIETAPTALRSAVDGLTEAQLGTRYRNWTIRQIVHHLADSHVNSYVRFKLALTEETPTIKAYDEGRWAALEDSRTGAIEAPMALLTGLHERWTQLLRTLTAEQFARSFTHPETGREIGLDAALSYYAWHCKHHTAQIIWLRGQNRW